MKNQNITSCVKNWYLFDFQTDELGLELNWVTFEQVYISIILKSDLYKTIGVSDSLVRERLFSKLAEILKVDYSHIYNLWLNETQILTF